MGKRIKKRIKSKRLREKGRPKRLNREKRRLENKFNIITNLDKKSIWVVNE